MIRSVAAGTNDATVAREGAVDGADGGIRSHPTAPANQQIQILTVAKMPEQSEQPARQETSAPAPVKKPARKKK